MENRETEELKGYARFSPRLRLLQKLSKGDDPIISIAASGLIRDKVIRRVGIAFELYYLLILPVFYLLGSIWYVVGIHLDILKPYPGSGASPTVTHIIFWTIQVFHMLEVPVYLVGFFILLWPGRSLLMQERTNYLMRIAPIHPKLILKSHIMLQIFSYWFYPIITLIFGFVFNFINSFVYSTANPSMIIKSSILAALPYLLTGLGLTSFLVLFSIYSSLRFKSWFGSMVSLIVGAVFWLMLFFMGSGWINNPNYKHLSVETLGTIILIIFVVVTFAGALFLAYTSIIRCVMPEK